MKKLLLLLALLAFCPNVAFAQCSGVFANNTVCGNTSGSSAPPKSVAISTITPTLVVGTAIISGGTSGRVLYDNAGVLGEYTQAQLTGQINTATASLSGALPAWPNNTTTFFRGDGTYTAVGLPALATQATNTIVGNATSGSAAPTALAIGSCDTATKAVQWTTNTGFGCNTAITANAVAVGGITGLGTNVATALAVNVGSSGAFARLIASGAKALATGAISSATCTSAQTDTATGTLTSDAIMASFNADPTATTGYVPLTTGMLTIIAYPTADTVNFKVCNNTAASITPGAVTINWRVVR